MAEKLYEIGQPADKAYLLRSGEVEYWVTKDDYILFEAQNIIIGASELLIAMSRKEVISRHMTLIKKGDAVINPIKAEKLASIITTYTIGFSVARHIAETITKLHGILSNKMNKLHESERISRDVTKAYVEIMNLLEQESLNQHFPWLFSLLEKGKKSGAYNFGLSFISKKEETSVDVDSAGLIKYKRIYPKGSIICKQGDKADDMFILMDGKIEVRINNNPIDIISRKGTIIGEMGLILQKARTATLRALDDTHMVKIGSGDMASVFKNDTQTFFDMMTALAFREYDNCEKIREYSDMVELVTAGHGDTMEGQLVEYSEELSKLMSDIAKYSEENPKMDWLQSINELSSKKITNLLLDASKVRGDAVNQDDTDSQPEKEKIYRPVRDTTMPEIDWY